VLKDHPVFGACTHPVFWGTISEQFWPGARLAPPVRCPHNCNRINYHNLGLLLQTSTEIYAITCIEVVWYYRVPSCSALSAATNSARE